MDLSQFPRRIYTPYQTPLEALPNLEKELGPLCPRLFIKRDDQLGLAEGGNKTRKLEFLVGDALAKGADTLVTCGAIQSNHCRLTLSAAVREGLKCQFVLEERVPGKYIHDGSGNNFLYHLMGAEKIIATPKGSNLKDEMNLLLDDLKKEGRVGYIIPGGGSNEIGATGYADCAKELYEQAEKQEIDLSHIVCASGSSGTHAGLLAGRNGLSKTTPIIGISVMRGKDDQENLVHNLSLKVCNRVGASDVRREDVVVYDDYVGDGYALPTQGMIAAVKLLARTEGILLDPVYTGKAFDGFLELIKKGHFSNNDSVVFIHTGGAPALFAYEDIFKDNNTKLKSLIKHT